MITYLHMPFRLRLCIIFLLTAFISTSCKLSFCKLPYLYLENCAMFTCKFPSCKLSCSLVNCTITSCKLSSFKLLYLHHANCTMFSYKLYHNILETIISFQHWAVKYGLITQGVAVDLKSVTSIRAHLDGLSPDDVS